MKKIVAVLVLMFILGIGTAAIAATDGGLTGEKDTIPLAESVIQPLALPDQSDLVFVPLQPCRIIDTRNISNKIAGGATRAFYAYGNTFSNQGGYNGDCGVDPHASAIAVTLTSTQQDGPGNLRAWPYTGTMPTASCLNYMPGVNIANTTILPICLSCSAEFNVYANVSGTHLVADVVGYFIKKVPTVLYSESSPGALSVTTAYVDSAPVCEATAYTANGNQTAIIDGQLSMSVASGAGSFSTGLAYSTNGGTSWSAMNSYFSAVTAYSGGWATSPVSHRLNLTPGTTYTFAIQYAGPGANFTSADSRCHLRVMIIDR